VIGSGRERILPTLFGLAGSARWAGRARPLAARRHPPGIVLVPSDRKTQGLVLELSVEENVSLATLPRLQRFGFMDAARARADAPLDRAPVAAPARAAQAGLRALGRQPAEGGDRQDAGHRAEGAAARRAHPRRRRRRPRGALRRHRRPLARGLGLLLSSSDTEELLGLSDRILVFRGGRVVTELLPPSSTRRSSPMSPARVNWREVVAASAWSWRSWRW
jgi:ribose transport system ATP-binding protein